MHGMINRAFRGFVTETYGQPAWQAIMRDGNLPPGAFEAILTYDLDTTTAMLAAAASVLRRPREQLLEDFGHALVSHPERQVLRRLLRFSGTGFADFLLGLDELPGRARLALPDLTVPTLEIEEEAADRVILRLGAAIPGAGHVMLGLLRAMADDYGALVLLDHLGSDGGCEVIAVQLTDLAHADGRRFDLAAPGPATGAEGRA